MSCESVFIIDDDRRLLESMKDWLASVGFAVQTCQSGKIAAKIVKEKKFDLILCDLRLEDSDGIEFLRVCKRACPKTPVLLMTGYGGPDAAADAIAAGAFDLLTKPIIDQELMLAMRRALDQQKITDENERLKAALDRRFGMESILSHDMRMQQIFETIDSVADARANVLITGENGTGKSMIARAIHQRSRRRNQPFVEVACGALPDNLLESELFGHVAGSFTGASHNKIGKFQAADSGTLFLDEIGTASPALQVKLLRVLQELQFEPVGSNETVSVDTRVVFATNEKLEQAVADGRFRQDLFYRINVIHLELPALRQRSDDVPLLVEHFLQIASKEFGRNVEGFTPDAIAAMRQYPWPGNIRELENAVQRAVLLCKSAWIDVDHLPAQIAAQNFERSGSQVFKCETGTTLREALEGPERQIILEVLRLRNWNRNETAQQLGINRTTLYKKMKRLRLEELDPSESPT